jgi:hypothetical protein
LSPIGTAEADETAPAQQRRTAHASCTRHRGKSCPRVSKATHAKGTTTRLSHRKQKKVMLASSVDKKD